MLQVLKDEDTSSRWAVEQPSGAIIKLPEVADCSPEVSSLLLEQVGVLAPTLHKCSCMAAQKDSLMYRCTIIWLCSPFASINSC